MASEGPVIREIAVKSIVGVIVTGVVALVIAAAAWFSGILQPVWGLVGGVLGVSLPIPAWLLVLVSAILFVLALRAQRSRRRLEAELEAARKAEAVARVETTAVKIEAAAAKEKASAVPSSRLSLPTELWAEPQVALPSKLDALELQILEVLARADGNYLRPDRLSAEFGKSKLVIDQALDKLKARKLVHHYTGTYGSDSAYGLTAQGRDFVIEKGYVRK